MRWAFRRNYHWSGQLLYVMNLNHSSKLFLNVWVCLQVNMTIYTSLYFLCMLYFLNSEQLSNHRSYVEMFWFDWNLNLFCIIGAKRKRKVFTPFVVTTSILLSQLWTAIRDEESCSSYLSRSIYSSVWTDLLWRDSGSPKFSILTLNLQLFRSGCFHFLC